jgi:hypothetical protein
MGLLQCKMDAHDAGAGTLLQAPVSVPVNASTVLCAGAVPGQS